MFDLFHHKPEPGTLGAKLRATANAYEPPTPIETVAAAIADAVCTITIEKARERAADGYFYVHIDPPEWTTIPAGMGLRPSDAKQAKHLAERLVRNRLRTEGFHCSFSDFDFSMIVSW